MTIDEILAAGAPPIAAILRGIRPEEAVGVASALKVTATANGASMWAACTWP